jgi:hypothetical protein
MASTLSEDSKAVNLDIRFRCSGIGYWQSGNVWSVLANQDHLAGTTVNKPAVISNLNTAFRLHSHYDAYGCVLNLVYF